MSLISELRDASKRMVPAQDAPSVLAIGIAMAIASHVKVPGEEKSSDVRCNTTYDEYCHGVLTEVLSTINETLLIDFDKADATARYVYNIRWASKNNTLKGVNSAYTDALSNISILDRVFLKQSIALHPEVDALYRQYEKAVMVIYRIVDEVLDKETEISTRKLLAE